MMQKMTCFDNVKQEKISGWSLVHNDLIVQNDTVEKM